MGNKLPSVWQVVHALERKSNMGKLVQLKLRPDEGPFETGDWFYRNSVGQYAEHWFGKAKIPYGKTTLYSPGLQEGCLRGLEVDGAPWHTGLSWVKQNSLRTLVTREQMSYQACLQLLKLKINLTDPTQIRGCGKYLGRINTHQHGGMKFGHVKDVKRDGPDMYVKFNLEGFHRDFTLLVRDPGDRWPEESVSGFKLWDDRFASLLLDRHVPEGSVLQVTGVWPSPIGVDKGHAVVRRSLVDMVIYDYKPVVSSIEDTCMVGILNVLHGGSPAMTDSQSTINLGLTHVPDSKGKPGGYYQELGANYMYSLFNILKTRALLEPELNKMHRVDDDGDFVENLDWVLAAAHKYGLMSLVNEDGERVVFNALEEKWMRMQMDSHQHMNVNTFRYPLGKGTYAGYVCPDLSAIDNMGFLDTSKGVLQRDECYCGRVGECIIVRTPMGHPGRYSKVKAVIPKELEPYNQGILVMFNPLDIASKKYQLEQEDWDNDDRVRAMFDPQLISWVSEWTKKYPYPDVPLEIKPVRKGWMELEPEPIKYSESLVFDVLQDMKKGTVSIGVMDNLVRLDVAQTTMRDEMVASLLDPLANSKGMALPEVAKAMTAYTKYLAAKVGCNSGKVIDAANKGASIAPYLEAMVRWFLYGDPDHNQSLDATVPAIPRFWLYSSTTAPGGDRRSKMLKSRDIPVVMTHMDRVRDKLAQMRDDVMEVHLKEYLQKHAYRPREEFATYPVHPAAIHVAHGIRERYRASMKQSRLHAKNTGSARNPLIPCTCTAKGRNGCASIGNALIPGKEFMPGFMLAQEEAYTYATKHPIGKDAWLELVHLIYLDAASSNIRTVDPDADDPGSSLQYTSYGDAILWGPKTGHLTIETFKRVGMAREPKAVQFFDHETRSQYRNRIDQVTVKDTLVYLPGTTGHIGQVDLVDGQYEMCCGRVWVPLPEDLTPTSTNITLFVVNGWEKAIKEGAPQSKLDAWHRYAGHQAVVKSSTYTPEGGKPEASAEVWVGDKRIAMIGRNSLALCYQQLGQEKELHGWLDPLGKYTMLFMPDVTR